MAAFSALLSLLPRRDPEAELTLADAREAVVFWRARAARLPWHRRGARGEARTMLRRWRVRLLYAHLAVLRLGWLAERLPPLLDVAEQRRGGIARGVAMLTWHRIGHGARRLLLTIAALAVVSAIAALSLLVLLLSLLL